MVTRGARLATEKSVCRNTPAQSFNNKKRYNKDGYAFEDRVSIFSITTPTRRGTVLQLGQ